MDSYSTDNTVELAAPLADKVIRNPFENFGKQRNMAMRHASHDWVFFYGC